MYMHGWLAYRTSPLYPHTIKHVRRKQWEHARDNTPHEGVPRDGGRGKHEVSVDDVVEEGEKNGPDTEAGADA